MSIALQMDASIVKTAIGNKSDLEPKTKNVNNWWTNCWVWFSFKAVRFCFVDSMQPIQNAIHFAIRSRNKRKFHSTKQSNIKRLPMPSVNFIFWCMVNWWGIDWTHNFDARSFLIESKSRWYLNYLFFIFSMELTIFNFVDSHSSSWYKNRQRIWQHNKNSMIKSNCSWSLLTNHSFSLCFIENWSIIQISHSFVLCSNMCVRLWLKMIKNNIQLISSHIKWLKILSKMLFLILQCLIEC